jgi:hypothetical protein
MLSINFYSGNGQATHSIRVVDDFYEWLARWSTTDRRSSEFSKVGRSQLTPLEIEGETAELPLVDLGTETRSRLIEFFSECIFRETRSVLGVLDNAVPQRELAVKTYRLKKLLEMLDCLKSGIYQYLQRE